MIAQNARGEFWSVYRQQWVLSASMSDAEIAALSEPTRSEAIAARKAARAARLD